MSRWWIFLAAGNSDWQKFWEENALPPVVHILSAGSVSVFVGQLMKSATSKRSIKVQTFFRHETRYTWRNTQDVKGLLLWLDDSFLAAVLLDSPRPFMVQQRSFPRAMPQQIGISKCLSAIHCLPQLAKANCCCHKFGSPHTCRGRNLGALRKPR